MCIAAAIAGSAVVGAGASLYSANKAGKASKKGSQAAIEAQQQQYQQTRTDLSPYRTTGSGALNQIAQLYGLDYIGPDGKTMKGSGKPNFSVFTSSPDYQFNLQQGQQAIDRSAAARGGLLSGAAVKEGQRYASGLAANQLGDYYGRLAGIAGLGENAAAATGQAGANAANNISGAYQNAANTRASAYMDMGQTIGNTVNGLAGNYLLSRYYRPPDPSIGGGWNGGA